MAVIGFKDVKDVVDDIVEQPPYDRNPKFVTVQVGAGSKSMHVDEDGLWMGADKKVDAPFSVDMEGNVTLNSITSSDVIDQINEDISEVSDDVSSNASNIATLQANQDSIEIQIAQVGGTNLLKNSCGINSDISVWTPDIATEPRNDATVVSTTGRSESGKGFSLTNQYLKQTISTIVGETYTFYARFKKTVTQYLTVTGYSAVEITTTGYISGDWDVFKYEFVAQNTTTDILLENTDGSGYCILSDMVVKLGIVTGWVQAPNEVYGSNFKFDVNGLEITNTASQYKSVLDNEKLAVYDTAGGGETEQMIVGQNYARIRNVSALEEFTVRRASSPSQGLRFIPDSDGVMLVINS